MFGGWAKRTPLAQGWAREWWKGVELLTYCYLGNSTKCSSPTPSPCRRLSLFLRFSLSSPFLHSPSTPSFSFACFFSLVHPFSFLSCSVHSLFYGRAASLQRGSVGVASISRTKKSYLPFADARTPLSGRTGRPTTRTRTRSKTMWNRKFSWKPILQGFVSQLRSLMLKDVVATRCVDVPDSCRL